MPTLAEKHIGMEYGGGATQGDDYTLRVPMWDITSGLPYPPYDPTGVTFTGSVRPGPASTDVWDFAVDVEYDVGISCTIVFSLTSAQTAEMPQDCWYDLKLTVDAPEQDFHFMGGKFKVRQRITA